MNDKIRIVHYADVPQGGFAGIVEKQLVISPKLMPNAHSRADISHGFGDFIYLATGHFNPNDGARLHPHENVDIVTVVLSGSIAHAGTLADGTVIHAPGVQVQRSGTGMRHAEVSPDDRKADFVQLWFLPPTRGLTPDYQNFTLKEGELTTVLGGDCLECFDNNMTCQTGTLPVGTKLEYRQQFVALITKGDAVANGIEVTKGDLIEGKSLNIEAKTELGIVVIR